MRIALADDGGLWREGLARLLELAGCEVTGQAADGDELLDLVRDDPPDAVVLDIHMPPGRDGGIPTAARLRELQPELGLLFLSQHAETPYLVRILQQSDSRAVGYRLKDSVADVRALYDTLTRIRDGELVIEPELVRRLVSPERAEPERPLAKLTATERKVLELMAEGLSNSGIAARLTVTVKAVEGHVSGVFTKLGLPAETDGHRRVLAVLQYLRSRRPVDSP